MPKQYKLHDYQQKIIDSLMEKQIASVSVGGCVPDLDYGRTITLTAPIADYLDVPVRHIRTGPEVSVIERVSVTGDGRLLVASPFGVDIDKVDDYHLIRAREKFQLLESDFNNEGVRRIHDKERRRKQSKAAKQARKRNRQK